VSGYNINDGNGGNNYSLTTHTNSGAINPADLVIHANDASKLYGQVIPQFSATYSGFVSGEDLSIVHGLQFGTDANQISLPGLYTIFPYGATADNYQIQFVNGTLTVPTPAP